MFLLVLFFRLDYHFTEFLRLRNLANTILTSVSAFLTIIENQFAQSRDQRSYRDERPSIVAISSGSRDTFTASVMVHVTFDKSGARLSGFARILAPGAGVGQLTTNYINLLVARERITAVVLRGWRAACVFQGYRSSPGPGWQRRGRKRSRRAMLAGGRGVRDRKALAKRKVVHQTDGPVDARAARRNILPRLRV